MDLTRALRQTFPIALALACAPVGSARAESSFFDGKTISLVVASPPGGGYDTLARVLAVYLPAHVAGHPKVVVQNMPGAGGITEMNYLYTTAPRDGTVIGSVQNSVPFEPLFGTKQAKYDSRKFIYLGTPDTETDVLAAWRSAGVRSIDDLKQHTFTIGSTGAKSNPSLWAEILAETLGPQIQDGGRLSRTGRHSSRHGAPRSRRHVHLLQLSEGGQARLDREWRHPHSHSDRSFEKP